MLQIQTNLLSGSCTSQFPFTFLKSLRWYLCPAALLPVPHPYRLRILPPQNLLASPRWSLILSLLIPNFSTLTVTARLITLYPCTHLPHVLLPFPVILRLPRAPYLKGSSCSLSWTNNPTQIFPLSHILAILNVQNLQPLVSYY